MIVKFHPRGAGRGSGPIDYLLGKDRKRQDATLDRGKPDEIQDLINASTYAKKYTSGVLSFLEPDLDRNIKDQIMNSFEQALLPGLDADQYSCLWVEHRDKGRLELNFVIPNIELLAGKRLQPYYHKADMKRINAWKNITNATLNLHDPDDPLNKRELVTPRNLPRNKQQAAEAITNGLLMLASKGLIKDRQDVIQTLTNNKFFVTRRAKKSISIGDPDGGQNIRLRGLIFEQDFRFGTGLRTEIEAASQRYREQATERLQAARAIYQRGIEIKRAENQKRHQRPQRPDDVAVNIKNLVKDDVINVSDNSHSPGLHLLSDQEDQSSAGANQRAKKYANTASEPKLGGNALQQPKGSIPHPSSGGGHSQKARLRLRPTTSNQTGLTSNERIREATVNRVGGATRTKGEATHGLSDHIQQLRDYIQEHIERERYITSTSVGLENIAQQLQRQRDAEAASTEFERASQLLDEQIGRLKRTSERIEQSTDELREHMNPEPVISRSFGM